MILALWIGLHAFGLGPAILLRRRAALPLRFLGPLAVALTATIAYGIFLIAFVVPPARLALVGAALLASLALTAWAGRRPGTLAELRAPAAWGPAALGGALAVIYLLPLLAGGPIVNDRFAWKLPSDNILPAIVADRVVLRTSTERPVPPLWPDGDRASERPPLQAAVVVTVGTLVPGIASDEYQVLATLCQAQWLPAVLLVAAGCGLRRPTTAFVLAACATSGFFFVNTIYTWPKLFAASSMLSALAIAIGPAAGEVSARRARAIAVAALIGCSLLAHPGSAFTLLAVPVCWPLLRGVVTLRVDGRSAVAAMAVAAALAAPWMAYQAFVDPPESRLVRQHFGDGRADGTALEAIVRANAERPIGEHVRVRLGNLVSQIGRPATAVWPGSIAEGHGQQFFRHGSSLGLLLMGLVAVLAGWRRDAQAGGGAIHAFAWTAMIALAGWSVLVFGRDQALIHHGSPVTTILLFVTGACGLARLPRPLAAVLLLAHAAIWIGIWYVPVWVGPWLQHYR
jgi:hypothetical protein